MVTKTAEGYDISSLVGLDVLFGLFIVWRCSLYRYFVVYFNMFQKAITP